MKYVELRYADCLNSKGLKEQIAYRQAHVDGNSNRTDQFTMGIVELHKHEIIQLQAILEQLG